MCLYSDLSDHLLYSNFNKFAFASVLCYILLIIHITLRESHTLTWRTVKAVNSGCVEVKELFLADTHKHSDCVQRWQWKVQ